MTVHNRWEWWGERSGFLGVMEGLAAASTTPKTIMIDRAPAFAEAGSISKRAARHRPCG